MKIDFSGASFTVQSPRFIDGGPAGTITLDTGNQITVYLTGETLIPEAADDPFVHTIFRLATGNPHPGAHLA